MDPAASRPLDCGQSLYRQTVAWGCNGIILPFAIGAVAMSYRRAARATALGIAYAVYSAGVAIAPVLALALGAQGPIWPAFLACAVTSLLAIRLSPRLGVVSGAPRD